MASSSAKFQKFFGDAFKESWLSMDGFEDYFSRVVSSLTSDKIVREKERWEDEERRLLDEQRSLAFRHYQSFVATAECSNDIRQSFDKLESQLGTVIGTVPNLQDAIQMCTEAALETNKMRQEANVSLAKHPQILEILELPQLIDTSIRNNFHEEGLELHSFVCNLAVKHTDIPIIQMIKADSDQCILHMEETLLKQLRSQISLAQCLKCVGLLKRIGTYTDTQLKVKFLEVRTEWFRHQLDTINKTEIQFYMCKMIDVYRVNLFDIITQYRSVFFEEKTTNHIFNSWLHQQVLFFVELLMEHLPRCSGSLLDSTLAQAMYFGMSLGRVGADFRGILVPVFQRRILELASGSISRATATLTARAGDLLRCSSAGDSPSLLSFPPLAVYRNSLTATLNELRHCAPVSLSHQISRAVQSSLSSVIDTCISVTSDSPKLCEAVCTVLTLDLIPSLNTDLCTVFKLTPAIYKCRPGELNSFKTGLDVPALREPLLPLLSTASRIIVSGETSTTDELEQPEGETSEETLSGELEPEGEIPADTASGEGETPAETVSGEQEPEGETPADTASGESEMPAEAASEEGLTPAETASEGRESPVDTAPEDEGTAVGSAPGEGEEPEPTLGEGEEPEPTLGDTSEAVADGETAEEREEVEAETTPLEAGETGEVYSTEVKTTPGETDEELESTASNVGNQGEREETPGETANVGDQGEREETPGETAEQESAPANVGDQGEREETPGETAKGSGDQGERGVPSEATPGVTEDMKSSEIANGELEGDSSPSNPADYSVETIAPATDHVLDSVVQSGRSEQDSEAAEVPTEVPDDGLISSERDATQSPVSAEEEEEEVPKVLS